MYDTAAVQEAITATSSFALVFSFLAILRDPWYSTPLLYVSDVTNIAIGGAGIIAEIAFAISVLMYADSRKEKAIVVALAFTALVAPLGLLTFSFLGYNMSESREHFFGVTITVLTFVAVVFILYDLRLIWKNNEIKNQPFISVVCNLCGSANMCGFGVLTHNKFLWIRHVILSVANGIILVVLVVYYRSMGERPYHGFVEFVRSRFHRDESEGPIMGALRQLEEGLLELDERLVDWIAQLKEVQALVATELQRVRVSRVRADPDVASTSGTHPEIEEVDDDD